jgi:hypothetical protein
MTLEESLAKFDLLDPKSDAMLIDTLIVLEMIRHLKRAQRMESLLTEFSKGEFMSQDDMGIVREVIVYSKQAMDEKP